MTLEKAYLAQHVKADTVSALTHSFFSSYMTGMLNI